MLIKSRLRTGKSLSKARTLAALSRVDEKFVVFCVCVAWEKNYRRVSGGDEKWIAFSMIFSRHELVYGVWHGEEKV
jgi:hypothetical protein